MQDVWQLYQLSIRAFVSFTVSPEVKLTKLEVTESEIQVSWKFGSDEHRRKRVAEDDVYSVRLQIQYKKNSDKKFSIYPTDGSKIPAEEVSQFV